MIINKQHNKAILVDIVGVSLGTKIAKYICLRDRFVVYGCDYTIAYKPYEKKSIK